MSSECHRVLATSTRGLTLDQQEPSPADVQAQIANVAARKATNQAHRGQESLVPAAKLAKNKRLPATMITPGGKIEASKKVGKGRTASKKKKAKSESAKEKALERMEQHQVKIKASEDRKVSLGELGC